MAEQDRRPLTPPDTCECGSRLKDGWCGTCREFIWRIR
jgi:hypothetical protein